MDHLDLTPGLTLEWLPGRFAVCRLDAHAALPGWLGAIEPSSRLISITRTERELSIVIDESHLPVAATDSAMPTQHGFVALRVVGTLDFGLVGVLSKLTAALAVVGVSVFVISTYDTDIILLQAHAAQAAFDALRPICRIPPPPAG